MPSKSESTLFIHPSAICESSQVGRGTKVWAFAHVMDGAVIGENCNIGDHAFIEGGARIGDGVVIKNQVMVWNGVTIEDEVFVGPGVIFTNDRYPRSRMSPPAKDRYAKAETWLVPTRVCRGVSIGAGAIIMCGITIGEYASIGAGALVTRDVPDHALVVGQPAQAIGRVCDCGSPLADGECPTCRPSKPTRVTTKTLTR